MPSDKSWQTKKVVKKPIPVQPPVVPSRSRYVVNQSAANLSVPNVPGTSFQFPGRTSGLQTQGWTAYGPQQNAAVPGSVYQFPNRQQALDARFAAMESPTQAYYREIYGPTYDQAGLDANLAQMRANPINVSAPNTQTWARSPYPKNMPVAEQKGFWGLGTDELNASAEARGNALAEYLYPDALPPEYGPAPTYDYEYGGGGAGGGYYSNGNENAYAWMSKLLNWKANV